MPGLARHSKCVEKCRVRGRRVRRTGVPVGDGGLRAERGRSRGVLGPPMDGGAMDSGGFGGGGDGLACNESLQDVLLNGSEGVEKC